MRDKSIRSPPQIQKISNGGKALRRRKIQNPSNRESANILTGRQVERK